MGCKRRRKANKSSILDLGAIFIEHADIGNAAARLQNAEGTPLSGTAGSGLQIINSAGAGWKAPGNAGITGLSVIIVRGNDVMVNVPEDEEGVNSFRRHQNVPGTTGGSSKHEVGRLVV